MKRLTTIVILLLCLVTIVSSCAPNREEIIQTTENNTESTMISTTSVPVDDRMRTLSGDCYTVTGYSSSGRNNTFGTNDTLTYLFDDFSSVGTYNYFSVSYTAGASYEATLTFQGGKTEHFYLLQSAVPNEFSSLIANYKTATMTEKPLSLTLKLLSDTHGNFVLKDLKFSKKDVTSEGGVVYLQNNKYKVGIQLDLGGGIGYFEDLQDGDSTISNLLNCHDTGRLVQQSYYGTSSDPNYTPAKFGGVTWNYNPVQGGDQYNHKPRLIDVNISEDGKTVTVKCQPLDWAKNNSLTPSYMENTYILNDTYLKVKNTFVDFSGYSNPNHHQELPAFYTISYLSNFQYVNEQGSIVTKSSLPYWAGNEDCYFTPNKNQNWCAWTAPSGFGIGVYTPIAEVLYAGRYLYDGSKLSTANSTNYVSPLRGMTITSYNKITYDYYITTGTATEIQTTFSTCR